MIYNNHPWQWLLPLESMYTPPAGRRPSLPTRHYCYYISQVVRHILTFWLSLKQYYHSLKITILISLKVKTGILCVNSINLYKQHINIMVYIYNTFILTLKISSTVKSLGGLIYKIYWYVLLSKGNSNLCKTSIKTNIHMCTQTPMLREWSGW